MKMLTTVILKIASKKENFNQWQLEKKDVCEGPKNKDKGGGGVVSYTSLQSYLKIPHTAGFAL